MNHAFVGGCASSVFFGDAAPAHAARIAIEESAAQQLADHRGQAAGAMEILAEIVARGLTVREQRNVESEALPVVER